MGVAVPLPGVLGFIPGITTRFAVLSFAGHESGAKLLGMFGISVLLGLGTAPGRGRETA